MTREMELQYVGYSSFRSSCNLLTLDQDDIAAINRAITNGNRCGENCYGSTIKSAVVYFPPGENEIFYLFAFIVQA